MMFATRRQSGESKWSVETLEDILAYAKAAPTTAHERRRLRLLSRTAMANLLGCSKRKLDRLRAKGLLVPHLVCGRSHHWLVGPELAADLRRLEQAGYISAAAVARFLADDFRVLPIPVDAPAGAPPAELIVEQEEIGVARFVEEPVVWDESSLEPGELLDDPDAVVIEADDSFIDPDADRGELIEDDNSQIEDRWPAEDATVDDADPPPAINPIDQTSADVRALLGRVGGEGAR